MRSKHYKVRCVADFTHVIPASVLEICKTGRLYGNVDARIETPERRIDYKTGQVFDLSGARARKEFCKAWPGAFEILEE